MMRDTGVNRQQAGLIKPRTTGFSPAYHATGQYGIEVMDLAIVMNDRKQGDENIRKTKVCPLCGRTRGMAEFYRNSNWKTGRGRDLWCMDCAKAKCASKLDLQRYCHENRRLFSQSLWDKAVRRAQVEVASDERYMAATEDAKARILSRVACGHYFRSMNLAKVYVLDESADTMTFEERLQKERLGSQQIYGGQTDAGDYDPEDEREVYSMKFGGWFKGREIRWLESYYARMADTFDLSDPSLNDYCIKNAVASLVVDTAADKYRRGEISLREYKDAMAVYDMTSKSANFAACKREIREEKNDLGSLGE